MPENKTFLLKKNDAQVVYEQITICIAAANAYDVNTYSFKVRQLEFLLTPIMSEKEIKKISEIKEWFGEFESYWKNPNRDPSKGKEFALPDAGPCPTLEKRMQAKLFDVYQDIFKVLIDVAHRNNLWLASKEVVE